MKKYIYALIVLWTLPLVASAATLQFLNASSSVHVGDTFAVGVDMNTGQDSINAIEGSLQFSQTLSLQDIRFTGSLVPLWVTQPALQSARTVTFAGVLPNGYQGAGALSGTSGNIFTLIFKAQSEGAAQVSFGTDTSVYRNDGKGTKAALTSKSLDITIAAASGEPSTVAIVKDTTPPEAFVPHIVSGAPFGYESNVLVFATEDKDSGIDHYDIARSFWQAMPESMLSWQVTQSPYVLTGSDESQYLYIRAVDKTGNTRVAIVPPQQVGVSTVANAWETYLVILGVLALLLWWYKRRRS